MHPAFGRLRQEDEMKSLETIQRRFVRTLAFRAGLKMDRFFHDYSEIASMLDTRAFSLTPIV